MDPGNDIETFFNRGFRSLSFLAHALGLAALTHCLSRRLLAENFSREGLKRTTWARMCLILLTTIAWIFVLCSKRKSSFPHSEGMSGLMSYKGGTLVHGAGFEGRSELVCMAASYLSIALYAICKFLVYAYLTDRVQTLWSPDVNNGRPRTYIYFTSLISAVAYCIIATLSIGSPISDINSEGVCQIGLKPLASIPLLVFHVYVNIFVTFLFLFPLVNWTVIAGTSKRLAYRLALAAFIALSTSTVNVLVLILSDGRETGWVYLTACVGDIVINVTSMFWASVNPKKDRERRASRTIEQRARSPSVTSLASDRNRHPHDSHDRGRRTSQRPESLLRQQQVFDELGVPQRTRKTSRTSSIGIPAHVHSGNGRPRSHVSAHTRNSRSVSQVNVQEMRPSSLSTSITAVNA
ncbi:hypothetical protein FA15DRAFT_757134 [Coprinopsis marcescibilis]|uniref:Uncharacterized protein n=1 Tax=Coprinopsis marcescibilis TaxID=230819 RepID=A0A5C3KUW5_COPMA|nr:hypothetical protein FA15DRAFT_757134 [Coprinopsis marcescibilis]